MEPRITIKGPGERYLQKARQVLELHRARMQALGRPVDSLRMQLGPNAWLDIRSTTLGDIVTITAGTQGSRETQQTGALLLRQDYTTVNVPGVFAPAVFFAHSLSRWRLSDPLSASVIGDGADIGNEYFAHLVYLGRGLVCGIGDIHGDKNWHRLFILDLTKPKAGWGMLPLAPGQEDYGGDDVQPVYLGRDTLMIGTWTGYHRYAFPRDNPTAGAWTQGGFPGVYNLEPYALTRYRVDFNPDWGAYIAEAELFANPGYSLDNMFVCRQWDGIGQVYAIRLDPLFLTTGTDGNYGRIFFNPVDKVLYDTTDGALASYKITGQYFGSMPLVLDRDHPDDAWPALMVAGIAMDGGRYFRSTDGGASWSAINNLPAIPKALINESGPTSSAPVIHHTPAPGYIFLGQGIVLVLVPHDATWIHLYRSTDNGVSWSFVQALEGGGSGLDGSESGSPFCFGGGQVVVEVMGIGYRSKDLGLSWSYLDNELRAFSYDPSFGITGIKGWPFAPRLVWVPGEGRTVPVYDEEVGPMRLYTRHRVTSTSDHQNPAIPDLYLPHKEP